MSAVYNSIRIIIGLFFFIIGLVKLSTLIKFSETIKEYFAYAGIYVDSVISVALGVLVLFLEICLGALVIFKIKILVAYGGLLIIVSCFFLINLFLIVTSSTEECFCFGDIISSTPQISLVVDLTILLLLLFNIKLYLHYIRNIHIENEN